MVIGITVIICLLILILFGVSEVWCKLKDVQATLSWLIEKLGYMNAMLDQCMVDEEEEEE